MLGAVEVHPAQSSMTLTVIGCRGEQRQRLC
jgi:hypothetical protein